MFQSEWVPLNNSDTFGGVGTRAYRNGPDQKHCHRYPALPGLAVPLPRALAVPTQMRQSRVPQSLGSSLPSRRLPLSPPVTCKALHRAKPCRLTRCRQDAPEPTPRVLFAARLRQINQMVSNQQRLVLKGARRGPPPNRSPSKPGPAGRYLQAVQCAAPAHCSLIDEELNLLQSDCANYHRCNPAHS